MMRVLLEDGFSVEKGTGVGRYTQNLATELRKFPDIELLDPPSRRILSKIRPIGARRILYTAWLETVFQSRLVRTEPDIVHFTNYLIPRSRKSKAKYVATIHDLVAWKLPEAVPPTYAPYIHSVFSRIVEVADLILCPSNSVSQEVRERFNLTDKKVMTAWNGFVPLPAISSTKEAELYSRLCEKLGLQNPFLLFVGTMERRKNITTMIEAFARIADRHDLQLVMVGRPGYAFSKIQAAVQRQTCPDRYILTGFLSDEELTVLYKRADLFVYPSLYEGFGIPLVEAMGLGLPIVASQIPSTEEVAGEAVAYYGNPLDACALTNTIEQVITQPDLKAELARRGKARAATFTYDKVINQYITAYHSILDSR